jgi:hypothetical protein
MYRVVLEADSIPSDEGPAAAVDIAKEFAERRQHHSNVTCSYADQKLTLTAENDFDPDGVALQDEFSDCICAFVRHSIPGMDRTIILKSAISSQTSN